eukprot:GHVH01006968.1.p1 GENE.GHVH01006968.1~~GHVH01006968.1.p1  ORF type:complete len:465 (-),score=66.87 GHVH01006968.1:38-1432(-)
MIFPQESRTLEGKNVIFVACGCDLNKSFLYEGLAKKNGLNIILLESAENLLAQRMHRSGFVNHVSVDMTPRASMVSDIIAVTKKAMAKDGLNWEDIDGVTTFWDDAVALTARIANWFSLPSSSVESVDISHDKFATRVALMNNGLPYPHHTLVTHGDDVMKKMKEHGMNFPVVLKPVQGATSIGVYVCHDATELQKDFEDGYNVLLQTYASNELMGLVFEDAPSACTKVSDQLMTFVLEEYIDGEEVDIDMIVDGGDVVYAKVSDDWEPEKPWRTETGVNYPSRLPQKVHDEFIRCATNVVQAFGITHGVLHVEMKYSTKYGPMLIELNPRMGGGPCHFFHKELFGVDLALEHVMIATGQKSQPKIKEASHWGVGLLLYAPHSGVLIQDVDQTEEYRELLRSDYIVNLSMPNQKGDRLSGWYSSEFPSHAGLLMCCIPKSEMDVDAACAYTLSLRAKALSAIKY